MVPAFTNRAAMGGFSQGHLRKRSSIPNLAAVFESSEELPGPSPTDSSFSDVTAYEDDPIYPEGKKGEYSAVEVNEDLGGWRVASERKPRPKFSGVVWAGSLLIVGATIGWLARPGETASSRPYIHRPTSKLPQDSSEKCNAYEQHGLLQVDPYVPSLNRWRPIGAPASCEPVDFMSAILETQMGSPTINPKLESLRDRTVLIFGDSVDRDHNEDFCGFVAGDYEMIGGAHPLAPPYPKGEELPADGYRDYISGQQMWPDNPQSRPYICHVPSLNLRFINVFQWGFFDYDLNWIRNHPHFYPPLNPEDRFDQVVVPLLANIAKKYGTSAVPDIITISPSYWNMGMANDTAWMAPRIEQVIRKLASGWSDAAEKPMILWKSPHRMKTYDMDAITLVESFNQIGRSVVERLVGEASEPDWKHPFESPEVEDLSSRLRIDEWGQLMLGQEMHFKDHLHPLPLPGSFLWGNMMLDKLSAWVESKGL